MRRRVLLAIVGLTVISVVLFGLPLALVFERLQNEDASLRLEREAFEVSLGVSGDFALEPGRVDLPSPSAGIEYGIYDRDGSLVDGVGPPKADEVIMRALRNEIADVETPDLRVAAVPITQDQVVVGALRAAQSNVAGEARTAWILGTIGALALLVIGVGAVTGYVVSGRLARPVLSLRDAAVRLGDGDFTIEVPPSHVTEIDEAGAAVMATARRLDELVKRERMFSSDVSHQLRTPVAGLRAAIETELEFPREDSAEVLQEALVDLERLEKTIGELLAIARRRNDATQAISPDDLVQEVAGNWDKRFASVGRELVVSPHDETPPVRASRSMLIHTLDVLLDNALSHGEGEVQVRSQVGEEFVTLSVTDQGPGFSVVTGDSIPSSNAATAPGLGLPLAERLVEAMGGRLSVSRAGDQPRVDVVLKRADR